MAPNPLRARRATLLAAVLLFLFAAGCKDKGVAAPQPTGISPAWGLEETEVQVAISGDDFHPRVSTDFDQGKRSSLDTGFKASLGDFPLRQVTLNKDGTLSAVVPSDVPVGTYPLTVTDPWGRQGTLADAYRVVAASDIAVAVAAFRFDSIGGQQAFTAFPVTVSAVDERGDVVEAFNGAVALSDRTGTAVPTTMGMFALGKWQGLVEVRAASAADALVATGASGRTGTSNDFPVVARPAAALRFATAAQSVAAGACSQPVTVEVVDDLGAPRVGTAPVDLTIVPSSPALFALYADPLCTTPLSALSVAAGGSSANVWFRGLRAGLVTLSASATGLAGDAQVERIVPAAPAGLVFLTPPQVLNAGNCSQVATVGLLDAFGNAAPLAAAATMVLDAQPSAGFTFATDAACGAAVASLDLAAGDSQASFWFAGSVAGSVHVIASLPGLTDAAQDERIIPEGFATQLVFVTAPQSLPAGQCSGAVTVQAQDSHANAVVSAGAMQVSLDAVPAAGFTLFGDPGCTTPTTVTVIASQQSDATFWFAGTVAAASLVTASTSGLTSATQLEAIFAAPPSRLVFTTPPQTLVAGDCSAQVALELRDAFDNPAPPAAPLPVQLTATPAAGFGFFDATGCASSSSTVTIAAGSTTASFALRGTLAGTVQITASASGLTAASQNEVILPGGAGQLVYTTASQSVPADSCSGAVGLQVQDVAGNPAPVSADTLVSLVATPAGGFSLYSDAACSVSASGLTIATGSSTGAFFFKGTAAGAVDVAASSAGLPDAHQLETILHGSPAALAFTTPSRTVTAATCSPALTVEVRDSSGNASPVASDTVLSLSAAPAAGFVFYTDSSCASSSGTVTVLAATSSATFYFKATNAGATVVTVVAAGLGNVTQSEAVGAAPPDRVVFLTPARSATVGACSAVLTLQSRDASGNAAPVAAATAVALGASPAAGFGFFSDATCTLAVASVTIASGSSTASFYFKGTVPQPVTVTATPAVLAAASQGELVLPATAPTQLVFTTAPQAVLAGACSGTVTVESRDSFGNTQAVGANTTVNLTAAPNAGFTFYSDVLCANAVTFVTLASGTSSRSFYFIGTRAGNVTITAAAAGFNSAVQIETIAAAPPNRVVFTSASQRITAGTCSAAAVLESRDGYGNVSAPALATPVALSGNPPAGLTFYSNAGCTTAVASVPIAAGATTATFWFKDTAAGTVTLSASPAGWTGDSQAEIIDPGSPSQLVFTTAPQSLTANACSAVVGLQTLDPFGNVSAVGAATTVTLTAAPAAGFQFFTAAGCATATGSVIIASGSSAASFYVRGTAAGPVTVTASAAGMPNATQTETIVAGPPTKLTFTTPARTAAAGACSQLVTLRSYDAWGNLSAVAVATAVGLSAVPAAGFTFFADAACGTPATPTLAAGANTVSVYFRGTASGAVTVNATVAGWTGDSQVETLTPATPTVLAFTTAPQTLGASTCSSFATVQSRDAFGNVSPVAGATTVNLSAAPAAGFTFYSDPSCTTVVTSTTIAAAGSTASFYFEGTSAGSITVTAAAAGFTSAQQVETIVVAPVYQVGSFTKSTGGAPASQTVVHSLGVTPKALILWTTGSTNATPRASLLWGTGASSSPGTSRCVGQGSRDNVNPSQSARRMALKALCMVRWDQTTLVEADLTSWNGASFTLNWTTNDNNAYVIHYVLIGGQGVSSKMVQWQFPGATGNAAVTGVGFSPDAVLHFYSGAGFNTVPPANLGSALFGMGAMERGGTQGANGAASTDNVSPTNAVRAQRPGVAIYTASLPSLISKQATLVSMDADGFTLNYSVANNWTGYLYSLALAGGRVRVGSFTKAVAAAPAVQAVTGLGFKPNLVVLSSVQDVARASGTITNPARRGLGASDGTTAGCSAYSDEDGRNTSSVHAIDKTNKLFMKMDNATQTIDAEADLASLDADGFTLRWTTNDAVATEVLYFALGAP